MNTSIKVPLDVPSELRSDYADKLDRITYGSGRLMLFAGDQKVEHLNEDFYGEGISPEDADPIHLFEIASRAKIGCFAAQLGLIARYGMDFPKIPYLVKVNSKTNLVPTSQADPVSNRWIGIDPLIDFKKNSGLDIIGIGYTVYLGSEHVSEMLQEAARLIYHALRNGMIAVIWA